MYEPWPSPSSASLSKDVPPGQYIELVASDKHVLRSFVIKPHDPPRAALVLLQAMDQRTPAWAQGRTASSASLPGVNRHIRDMARQYAAQGYLVVCPSTFGRGSSGKDYGYRFDAGHGRGARIVKPLEPLASAAQMLDIEAAVNFARQASPAARVGLVGYCWGGLLAWRAAARWDSLQAVVSFYGGGMDSPQDRELSAKVPVQAHFSSGDAWMTAASVQAFAQAQLALAATSGAQAPEIHHYQAPYGFAHPGRKSHQPAAAGLAHERSLEFLARHLVIEA